MRRTHRNTHLYFDGREPRAAFSQPQAENAAAKPRSEARTEVPRAKAAARPVADAGAGPAPEPTIRRPAPIARVSAEVEDRLVSVGSKVEIAEQTLAPINQNLARDGQTLNADTLARLNRMRASFERAKRDVAEANEADAKESLSVAEGLADKLLRSVGR